MRNRKERATEILFARHAESKNNPLRIYSSRPENDPGLTVNGKRLAKHLARRLKKEKISVIYSSHLPRCLQTAAIVSKALKKKVVINKNFREPDSGKFELMKEVEIERKFPSIAKQWFHGDATNVVVGESFKAAQKRVWKEIDRLVRKHGGKKILIVTHQAPIKFVVCKLFGGMKYFNKFSLSNASLTLLVKKDKKYKLKYLNDISHLR